jgi:hypothetical protein
MTIRILKNGGWTFENPKINSEIRLKNPRNPKTLNLLYLLNRPILGKNKYTTKFTTLKNGEVYHIQNLKFYKNKSKTLHLSGPLEIFIPPTSCKW